MVAGWDVFGSGDAAWSNPGEPRIKTTVETRSRILFLPS
jgi:hypothetical protein